MGHGPLDGFGQVCAIDAAGATWMARGALAAVPSAYRPARRRHPLDGHIGQVRGQNDESLKIARPP